MWGASRTAELIFLSDMVLDHNLTLPNDTVVMYDVY